MFINVTSISVLESDIITVCVKFFIYNILAENIKQLKNEN